VSSRAVPLRLPGVRAISLRAPGLDALYTVGIAAALAAIAFGGKGGLVLERNTWVEIAVTLAGATVAAVAALVAPRPRRAWGAVSVVLLAALAAVTALSITWSVQPSDSWEETNRTFSYLAAFVGAVAFARLAPGRWGALIKGVALACVVVAGYALLTKVFPASLNENDTLGRLNQPFGYWNAVGLIAALAVPALVWLGAREEAGRVSRAVAPAGLGVALVAVMLSFSRGSLVAPGLGLAFWFALVPLRLRGAVVLLIGAAGAAAAGAWAFTQDALVDSNVGLADRTAAGHRFGWVLVAMVVVLLGAGVAADVLGRRKSLSEENRRRVGAGLLGALAAGLLAGLVAAALTGDGLSGKWKSLTDPDAKVPPNEPGRLTEAGSVRARYYRDGIRIFGRRELIGAGAGGYATARKRYREDLLDVRRAHGYVPQTLADLGLVGAGVSLLLLVAWGWAAARNIRLPLRRRNRDLPWTPERIGLVTLCATVIVFGVHSLIDWTWFIPGTAIVALLCAGFVAGHRPLGDVGGWRPVPQGAAAPAAALAIAAVALVAAWTEWQPLRSERASNAALSALEKNRIQDAYVDAKAATDRNPLSAEPLFNLAFIEDAVGRKKEAERALQRAVRLQPANPETWRQLADYQLTRLKQPRPAVAELRAALFLDPHNRGLQTLFVAALRAQAALTSPSQPPPPPPQTPPPGPAKPNVPPSG
jgi:tetratricopeptide (TPR) repeat protein